MSLQNLRIPSFGSETFRAWQRDTNLVGLPRLVGVAGSRGKSTTIRLIESVLIEAHLRRCTWTDLGVQINGERQDGELSGWGTAIQQLAGSELDIGLQELDWSTVNAVGLPEASYPAMILTGIRERGESGSEPAHLTNALKAANTCVEAVNEGGWIIANADDWYISDLVTTTNASVMMVSLSRETPALREHLDEDGIGVWIESKHIVAGNNTQSVTLGEVSDFPVTLQGDASFNTTNLLLAIGACIGLGIDTTTLLSAMRTFRSSWELLPASMNIYETNDVKVAIDQLAPAWIMKSVFRALNPRGDRRHITVLGHLSWIDEEDVQELGRLLGRFPGAIILHDDEESRAGELLRKGIAANQFPPVLISVKTEHDAIERAFKGVKSGDVVLVLTTHESANAHDLIRHYIPA